jgi:hypothetical protein
MPQSPRLESISDAATRGLAAEILERHEYAQYRQLSREWIKELVELLSRWFSFLRHLHDVSPLLYYLVLLGLVLLAGFLLAHVVWSVRSALRSSSPATPKQTAALQRDVVEEARALAKAGSYLEASHRLLLASLAHAARAQLLELTPDAGNRAVCERLLAADLPASVRQRLIELIRQTDALWFGTRAQSPELYEAWRSVYEQLRSAR